LRQRTELAEQKTAQAVAQQQIAQYQPSQPVNQPSNPTYIVQTNPSTVTTPNGVSITPGNGNAPGSNSILINGQVPGPNTIKSMVPNVPSTPGTYIQQPNGSMKKVSP
jgi:hypothetical protein